MSSSRADGPDPRQAAPGRSDRDDGATETPDATHADDVARRAGRPIDLAAAIEAGRKAGIQQGVRAGYQKGIAEGRAQAEAERPKGAPTLVVERDASGKPLSITEEIPDGSIVRKRIERDASGNIIKIVVNE